MSQEPGPEAQTVERILVAIDDSPATERTLRYVARIVNGRTGHHTVLYHRLPALPPELREHGGSSDPERESQLGRELSQRVAQWIEGLESYFRPRLEASRDQLIEAGVPAKSIDLCLDEDVSPAESLADALKRVAGERRCHTIVVARDHIRAMAGIDALLHRHTSDALVREGRGMALWVVE